MDSDTRYLLAVQLTKGRDVSDDRSIFKKAKELSQNQPREVVTDGLQSYREAFKKESFTLREPRVKHIILENLGEKPNNNLVERLHGTFKDRIKVMRGMKRFERAEELSEGYRIYYNFVKPHLSLNGKTPAEASGLLRENGDNRWLGRSLGLRSKKNLTPLST